MALNNVRIVSGGGSIIKLLVEDRTTSSDTQIVPGEPVKVAGTGANFVQHLATGEPVITVPMYGIATSYSTETSTVDGTVYVQRVIPGKTILEAKAHTGGNLSDGIINDTVTFDLTSTVYTVNEDEGTDPNVHGLEIISYDADADTVRFSVRSYATEEGSST